MFFYCLCFPGFGKGFLHCLFKDPYHIHKGCLKVFSCASGSARASPEIVRLPQALDMDLAPVRCIAFSLWITGLRGVDGCLCGEDLLLLEYKVEDNDFTWACSLYVSKDRVR